MALQGRCAKCGRRVVAVETNKSSTKVVLVDHVDYRHGETLFDRINHTVHDCRSAKATDKHKSRL